MVKKIALIGTLASGKTTLVNILGKRKGVAVVPEAARIYYAAHPELSPGSPEATKGIIELSHELEQEAVGSGASLIVCDRSALDAIAYFRAFGHLQLENEYFEIIKGRLSTYNHLFLLDPKDIPLQNDEIRRESNELRLKIHKAFEEVLAEREIPFTRLIGSVEERLSRIDRLLAESFT
ncbi:MAG: ATP-binding protein [Candidatus Levybacteria bacterium]|nr:ATP-binding protein [Candidatus Levybacteria bacterium]